MAGIIVGGGAGSAYSNDSVAHSRYHIPFVPRSHGGHYVSPTQLLRMIVTDSFNSSNPINPLTTPPLLAPSQSFFPWCQMFANFHVAFKIFSLII